MIQRVHRSAGVATAAVIAAVLVSGAFAPARAGWVATEKNGSTTVFADGRMKMSYPGGAMMLSAATAQLTVIDPANRVYATGSTDEYCRAAGRMVDEMIAGAPPEQRAMFEKMLGRDSSGRTHKVVVTESGTETLIGYATTRYRVLVDGGPYQDVWVTSDDALRRDTAALGKMSGQLTACLKTMGKGVAPEGSPEYSALMEKGLPLRIVSYQPDGSTQVILEMTALAAKDVGAGEFSIPDGYKKAPLDDMIRAQMGAPAAGSNPHGAGNPHGGSK